MSRAADIKALPISTGTLVKNEWQILKKLGEGGFGVVYECKNIRNPNQSGALKAEPFGSFKDDEVLKMEAHVLKLLAKSKHSCKLFATGKTPKYNFIVMTLLGKSLSELRMETSNQKFSRGTVVHIGLECTEAIEEVHKVGFVHRDIKPSNFAIGRKKNQQRALYIYDFGLCRQYMIFSEGGKTSKLRDPRKNVPFKGTVRYCSLNIHRFEEYGRHDDLWSMLYMLVEMYSGTLPWKGMDRRKAEATKESCDEEFRKMMPKEFLPIVKHLRKLNYLKTPDYGLIKDALIAACTRNKLDLNAPLDWEVDVSKKVSQKEPETSSSLSDTQVSTAQLTLSNLTNSVDVSTCLEQINLSFKSGSSNSALIKSLLSDSNVSTALSSTQCFFDVSTCQSSAVSSYSNDSINGSSDSDSDESATYSTVSKCSLESLAGVQHEKCFFDASTQVPQTFAFPAPIIEYIAMNPSSAKVYQKLIQTCKYFFARNPILVFPALSYLYCSDKRHENSSPLSCSCKWPAHRNGWEICDVCAYCHPPPLVLKDVCKHIKLWPTKYIRVSNVTPPPANIVSSSIFPRIFRFDVTELILNDPKISLNELILLAANVERLLCFWPLIKDENGFDLRLEDVIVVFPKLKYLKCVIQIIHPGFVQMHANDPYFENLLDFHMLCNPDAFDINAFCEFMIENKNIEYKLDFHLYFSPNFIKDRINACKERLSNEIYENDQKRPKITVMEWDPTIGNENQADAPPENEVEAN